MAVKNTLATKKIPFTEYVEEAVAEPVAAENENVIDAAVSEVEDFSDILEENE